MTEKARLLRILKDAGCDEATIEKYLQLQCKDRHQEQYQLLYLQRAFLLEQVHVSQQQIDCLDYLIFMTKKQKTKT